MICADFKFLFDRFDSLVLVLYVDEFIIVRCFKQLILWCETKLACELDLKNIGLLLGPRLLGSGSGSESEKQNFQKLLVWKHLYIYILMHMSTNACRMLN